MKKISKGKKRVLVSTTETIGIPGHNRKETDERNPRNRSWIVYLGIKQHGFQSCYFFEVEFSFSIKRTMLRSIETNEPGASRIEFSHISHMETRNM